MVQVVHRRLFIYNHMVVHNSTHERFVESVKKMSFISRLLKKKSEGTHDGGPNDRSEAVPGQFAALSSMISTMLLP
jgi:hypothetical protein